MIMILCVALAVQVVLFFMGQAAWFEPVGILVAIVIANGVASFSENSQEKKASALKAEEDAKECAKVIRDGHLQEVHVSEIVVGDLVYLQAGDKFPADGVVVEGLLKVDQAALNGETEEAKKGVWDGKTTYNVDDLLNPYYTYRGTVVVGGEGYVDVKVVGDATLFGKLALEVQGIMEGHKWELFKLIMFGFLGWEILCIPVFIGWLWLFPYMFISTAHFYEKIKDQGTTKLIEDRFHNQPPKTNFEVAIEFFVVGTRSVSRRVFARGFTQVIDLMIGKP